MKNQKLECAHCHLRYFSENVQHSPDEVQWLCPNCDGWNKVPEAKVVPLHAVPLKVQPNKDAIEMLEDMIERVKDGEITTVGLAYTTKSNSIGGDVSKGDNNFLMWASLEHLARTFYADIVLSGE